MSFEPQRQWEVLNWIFSSIKKQANYATLVADADLTDMVALIGADIGEVTQSRWTDQDRVGKQHEFPTTQRELMRDMRRSATMDLTSRMAGWAAAFCMGSVTTTTVGVSGKQHVIKFSSPSVSKQVPVATIYEQVWAQTAMERRLESMAVDSFTISGQPGQVAQLQMSLIGSGKVTTGTPVTVPSLSSIHPLDTLSAVFKLGTQGATTDLTDRLYDWSISVSQNLDAANGYRPGGGIYRTRMWFGKRAVTLQAKLWVDTASTDIHDLLLAQTVQELSLELIGDTLGTGSTHGVIALFPAIRVETEKIGVQGENICYQITATIYKDAGGTPNEPFQLTVRNDVTGYLG